MTPFFTLLDRFPPILCRLLAVREGEATPAIIIADECAIPLYRCLRLSEMTNWRDVTVNEARAFLKACGVDLENQTELGHKGALRYLTRRPRWTHLKKSPDWETYFKPLFLKWMESVRHHPEYETFYKPMLAKWSKKQTPT